MKKIYRADGTVIPTVNIQLWTINKFLRFTGLRLFVGVGLAGEKEPAIVGLMWYGWAFLGREDWNGEEV